MVAIIWGIDGVGEALFLLIFGAILLACVSSLWPGLPPRLSSPRTPMQALPAYARWLGGSWGFIGLLTFSSAMLYAGGWMLWRAIDIRTVKLTVGGPHPSHDDGDGYTIRDAAGNRYEVDPDVYERLRGYATGARVSCRVRELALMVAPSLRSCRLLSRPRPAEATHPTKRSTGDHAAG